MTVAQRRQVFENQQIVSTILIKLIKKLPIDIFPLPTDSTIYNWTVFTWRQQESSIPLWSTSLQNNNRLMSVLQMYISHIFAHKSVI
jgi:hypothetical protein